MPMNGQHLRQMGDQLQGTGTSAATALWNAAGRIERAEHPSADARVMVGLTARRALRLLQAVLLSELTRAPQAFTASVAAFANGVVREAGENLATFPYEERIRAFNGLAAELAAGLGLGLAEKVEAPPAPTVDLAWREIQQIAAFGLDATTEGTDAWSKFADIHQKAVQKLVGAGPVENGANS